MNLGDLRPAKGARHREKRIGCGPGSGHGKTSTKGHKGQGARSGGTKGAGFEGGQMPLIRRIPKFGFTPPARVAFEVVNLKDLSVFAAKETVTPDLLRERRISRTSLPVKILGEGALDKALTVRAHRFSQSAMRKIKEAGGSVEVIEGA